MGRKKHHVVWELVLIVACMPFKILLYLSLRAADKESSPPPEECLQLVSRATQVFRNEYILKQDLALEEIQRR